MKQTKMGVHLSQKKYIEDVLKQFNMQSCKAISVPMTLGTKVQLCEDSESTNATIYRSLVGKLLYLTHTMPKIVFAVNMCSRFMARPTKIQFWAAKQVLRYIAGIKDFGIQ